MTDSAVVMHSMWMAAESAQHDSVAFPTFLIVLIIAGVIYTFGYLRAVMHRANSDYKAIKAGVKPARIGFWKAWLAAVRVGVFVLLAFGALVVWVGYEARTNNADETKPLPASVSPSPSRARR
jgi:hypothetical protein